MTFTSPDKIIKTIEMIRGNKVLIKYKELNNIEYENTLASIEKIGKNVKWKPKISLIKSLKSYDKYLDI